jgi:hypothetical protein
VSVLIGLYSPAPEMGKSTLAHALAGHGFQVVRFSGPLKAMLMALLHELEVDDDKRWRMIEGDLKREPCDILKGRSPRHTMQTLGTEWGREQMHPDFWLHCAEVKLAHARERGLNVVFDDMRFPNEARWVREHGGLLVRVVRPGKERPNLHASEGGLDDHAFDLTIRNTALSAMSFALDASVAVARLIEQRNTLPE